MSPWRFNPLEGTIIATQPDLRARSPWSDLHNVKAVRISPSRNPIGGKYVVPGSKSFTNRALLIAAMADGESRLEGILRSDDSYWCIEAIRSLGIDIKVTDDSAIVQGCGGHPPRAVADLYIGAAGTTARFLPGLLAASHGGSYRIEGSHRLSERPMSTLIDALRTIGADIRYLNHDGFLPIEVHAEGLRGGSVAMSGSVSSQFISGLLIASAFAKEAVTLSIFDDVVQHAYVHITLDLMQQFGAKVCPSEDLRAVQVFPAPYRGQSIQLEADASTACYFIALAAITEGDVTVQNLGYRTKQPDVYLLDVLEKMGCTVERADTYIRCIGPKQLRGGQTFSMKEMSDQALTLAAIAPFADGPITVTDVAHIRHHESDRIRAACEALDRVGILVEEHEDGLTIQPGTPTAGTIDSHDDHRVAMSFALLGARVQGIVISDPGCVSKTCPTFFSYLAMTGVSLDYIR